jgi:hypothetical protein
MRRAALLAVALAITAPSLAADDRGGMLPYVWNDMTGNRDMPWMGSGGRARWYMRDTTKPWDVMNPRGPTIETRWGSSGGSGESPWTTGDRAVSYLERIGALKPWPTYPHVDGRANRTAFPYRITVVCIEPTIAILRFDLSAVIEDPIEFSFGALPPSERESAVRQHAGGEGLVNAMMFGTKVSARGSLSWFSPDANVPPTVLELPGGRGKISVRGVTLEVERHGDEITLRRSQ